MYSYSHLAIETRDNSMHDGPFESYTIVILPPYKLSRIKEYSQGRLILHSYMNSFCTHFIDCHMFFLQEHPPTLMFSFLTDFDWSITNDFILSASLDCTARVWDPASGQCLRVVNDNHTCGVTACRFQPVNNNMLVVSF